MCSDINSNVRARAGLKKELDDIFFAFPHRKKQRRVPAELSLVYIDATSDKAAHDPQVIPQNCCGERRDYDALTGSIALSAFGTIGTCFNKAIDDMIVPLKDSIE